MAIRTYRQALVEGATSRTYVVEGGAADSRLEPVYLQLTGTFSGATCTLWTSAADTSPLTWAAASSGAFTAAGSHVIELVPGIHFKLVNTGSASPQATNITYAVRGQIKIVA